MLHQGIMLMADGSETDKVQNSLELEVHKLRTEADGVLCGAETRVQKAETEASQALVCAKQEYERRVNIEAEIAGMRKSVTDAQKVASSAADECERLHLAVLAVSKEETQNHKHLNHRAKQLASELVLTRKDRNEKRRVCRRQALELASLRRWHESALLTQAGQFRDKLVNAELVQKENERLTDELKAKEAVIRTLQRELHTARNARRFS